MAIPVQTWGEVKFGSSPEYSDRIQTLERNDCPPPDFFAVSEGNALFFWTSPHSMAPDWENAIVELCLPYRAGRPEISCSLHTDIETVLARKVLASVELIMLAEETDSDEDR